MTREMIERLVKALSPVAEKCQLLHREHCVGEFLESGQSILDLGIAVQDTMLQMNRIETDGIEVLEE